MMPCMKRRHLLGLTLPLGAATAAGTTVQPQGDALELRWMFSSGEQRTQWVRVMERYRPDGLPVRSVELEQARYKAQFEDQLRERPAPDVMFWFGGERLREAVRQGLLAPLDALAERDGWSRRFTRAALDAVRVDGSLYALPLSTYAWGLYYRRSLWRRLQLQPPATWDEWLQQNDALRAARVAPLTVGAEDSWTLGAWFDYLNLRLHGKDFHQGLLAGRHSWQDRRIRAVLEHWQELWLRGDFQSGCERLGWRQVLPYVSRGASGMVLMGGFVALQFPAGVRADLGFVPFPRLRPRAPLVENAPLDVLVQPSHARHPRAAQAFLRHMAQPSVQAALNHGMGLLTPQHGLDPGDDPLQRDAAALLSQASASMQYFDRDSATAFSGPALSLLRDFVRAPEQPVEGVQAQLEALRQRLRRA
jgi:multiple sugar transport system substrate-binding protein